MDVDLTCIEPYPQLLDDLIGDKDRRRINVFAKDVQSVAPECFDSLGEGDLLFIDSTHVLKTGSDVVFELTQILPRLSNGVLVHFHDIFYPFEYPTEWIATNRSWNELYALRAFLTYNSHFKIVFFNHMFASLRRHVVERDCPLYLKNSGGSIWLRRTI